MSALTELGIVLTVIFVASLAVLAAQIAWTIWRRCRFLSFDEHRRGGLDGDYAPRGGFREPVKATKELLYFFCWKDSQSSSRVEPDARTETSAATTTTTTTTTEGGSVAEDGDGEVLKWHAMYRESRMLYTIDEEEKEGEDSAGGGGLSPGAEERKGEEWKDASSRECTGVAVVDVVEEAAAEPTPFSTPYGSPDRYFTPSPSPPRAERVGACVDYAEMAELC